MSDMSDGDCRLPSESNNFEGTTGRRSFLNAIGADAEALVCVRQVHGVTVVTAGEGDRGRGGLDAATAPAEADAIITDTPGLPIGVSIADCVPILLYDPRNAAGAVVHAGRVGTMRNIASNTVRAMRDAFDTAPEELHAAIGPSAGPERYEVSEGLADEFEALGLPRNGRLLDLWGANRIQLIAEGIPDAHIQTTGHCTIGDERFHSHRTDGSGCRNLAVLIL